MGRGKDGFSKIFGERRGTTVVPETESIDPEDALAEAHKLTSDLIERTQEERKKERLEAAKRIKAVPKSFRGSIDENHS